MIKINRVKNSVDEKFRFIKKPNKLSKDEETALKSIIFANELETKCNRLEKENAELVQKIHILEKQLDIATKALRKINNPTFGDIYNELTDEINYNLLMDIAQQALKEINEVKNDKTEKTNKR